MNVIKNKKVMLGVMSFLSCLAIVIISSFFPFIFEPSNLLTKKFWTNEIVIIAITLVSIISFVFIAQASNQQNPKSQIARANVEFEKSVNKIENHTRFYQWLKRVLQKKDKQEIIERKLRELGISDKLVYTLENNELEQLTSNVRINGHIYKALTKEQIEAVKHLKKKIGKLKFVNPSYYTTTKAYDAHKTFSELAVGESKKKTLTLLMDVVTKVIVTLIVAMVFTSFVRDLAQDVNKSEATYTFIVRVWTMITSAFVGYRTGSNINDIDAFYILKRVEVHKLYNEDNIFEYDPHFEEDFIDLKEEIKEVITNDPIQNDK